MIRKAIISRSAAFLLFLNRGLSPSLFSDHSGMVSARIWTQFQTVCLAWMLAAFRLGINTIKFERMYLT